MGKWTVVASLFTAFAVVVAPCRGEGQQKSFVGQTLRVGAWGGTFTDALKKSVGSRFEAETGAKVVYTAGNPSDYAAQLIAAHGVNVSLDIVYTDGQTQTDLVQQGLLEKLDTKAVTIPSDPEGFKPLNPGYTPTVLAWYIGIAYNTKKFDELGLPAPTSWSDLWNPKLAGRVALPDISTSMGIPVVAAAAAVAGKSVTDVEAGISKLAEIKVYSVYKSSSQMQNDFAAGNIWAAAAADGRAWQLADGGKPVSFVVPQLPGVGKPAWVEFTFVDVVKGTPRPELAKIFQRIAYSREVQIHVANATAYSPALKSAVEQLYASDPAKWKRRWPDPNAWNQLQAVDWKEFLPLVPKAVDLFNRRLGH